ncbi:ABC transporter permease [Phytoactinopolyspora mesophila]|uniref:FtsX-like permease family protein n=1 Tax=Phytoactinopolyspora mesophila TaxID=2650750 RepID=A0A7K3M0D2_9ACTN|nr:FtsX-like permease family protein [Phytoactinopolyspora mesophila]NDL56755.1 FtsX-like permease family protein [Phytoactinopolyspora mesophila]
MAAVAFWFRLDVRRRWRSLLVLALLIAVAAGTVMTAVAGARRGATAVDRLWEQTLPGTVLAFTIQPDFDWSIVRELPEVEALGTVIMSGYEIDGRPALDEFMPPPGDTELMVALERPVVLEGRLADPERADEVLITPAFEKTHGKGVGDTVTVGLYSPEQIDTLQYNFVWFNPEQIEAAVDAGLDPDHVVPASGPRLEATIVGMVRSPFYSDRTRNEAGFVIPSAGLYAEYEENLIGGRRLAGSSALVRLTGGEAALPEFQESLIGLPVRLENVAAPLRETRDVTGFEAASLYVFAVVSGAAAVVLVGLAVARHVASAMADLPVLRAVGMAPRQSCQAAALGPALAAFAGSLLSAGAATVASVWFPVGRASLVEPAPGVDVDVGVLVPVLAGVPAVVAAGAYVVALLAGRSGETTPATRRSLVVTSTAAAGAPVPVVVGAQLALEPGQGERAVPVRAALAGSATGVLGVLAALTFAGAVDDVVGNPARHGTVYEVEAWVGFENYAFTPSVEDTLAALASAPGVAGINNTRHDYVSMGQNEFMVNSLDPVGEPLDFVVLSGRLPVAATEVMLGPQSADEFGVGIGDTVMLRGTRQVELAVVGLGLVAPQDVQHATGALVTAEAYDSLFDGFSGHVGYIGLEPGVDPEEIIPVLYEAVSVVPGADIGIQPLDWLHELEEFRYIRALPLFLAGFLAVLALGVVGFALAAAVRRRRQDLAVLRALGMTPRQSRSVVVTQGGVIALAGLAAGLPLGVALGRTVWRQVAESMYLHYVPPVAWLALALAVPVTLLAAAVLAAWPAQRAAKIRIASALRTE